MADSKGTTIGKAYVQIVPSAKGIQKTTTALLNNEGVAKAGDEAGKSFGRNLVATLTKVVAAAGIGKIIKDTIAAGADLQQSIGGSQKIFGDSFTTIEKNAKQAFKTAGMSANDYMEKANALGATIKKSVGGNTEEAARIVDMAMRDMSDNANTFGGDLSYIGEVYQSIARGHYEMLDSLSLGYAGTKKGLQDLVNDANKWNEQQGKHTSYQVDNYADIVQAIHDVQVAQEVNGKTAEEAETTFTGSFNAMKSAWENFKGDLALGNDVTEDIEDLKHTVKTFLVDNLIPMVKNVLTGIWDVLPIEFKAAITGITTYIVASKVVSMFNGITKAVGGIKKAISGLGQAINFLMANPIVALIAGIAALAVALITLWNTNENFRNAVIAIWQGFVAVMQTIWDGIVLTVTTIWETIKTIFTTAWDAIKLVWDTVVAFFQGVWDGIVNVFSVTVTFFTDTFTNAWNAITAVWNVVTGFFQNIWNGITGAFSNVSNWFTTIFSDAWNGIKNIWNGVGSFFGDVWQTICDIFSNIGTTIGNAIHDAVISSVNGILWMVENTLNAPIRLLNGAIDIINYIPGVDIPHISELQLPRLAKGGILDQGARTVIAGEDGAEAIVPLERNTEWIKRVANEFSTQTSTSITDSESYDKKIDKIIELLFMLTSADPTIVLDTGVVAGAIDRRMGRMQSVRGRG